MLLKIIITVLIVSPLIKANYLLRNASLLPDEMFSLDEWVIKSGMYKYCWAY
jgi:hypothetical protein